MNLSRLRDFIKALTDFPVQASFQILIKIPSSSLLISNLFKKVCWLWSTLIFGFDLGNLIELFLLRILLFLLKFPLSVFLNVKNDYGECEYLKEFLWNFCYQIISKIYLTLEIMQACHKFWYPILSTLKLLLASSK